MFSGASTFDQNLSLWDVSSGTAFTDMFNGATSMSNSQGINSTPNISYFDATTGNDTITGTVGVVADSLRGHNGNDKLKGLSGDDTIFGDAGNDKLYGGKGADTLTGGDDRDKLVGGKGADTLIGGEGKDRLNGGLGKDTLTGGSGKDIFYLSANTGKDTITDYGTGNDQLKLTGGLTESDLTIRQSGADVRIKYDGDLMVIVQNTLADNLTFI
jgi:Ca2+-binding RTX toxin-like protein